MIGHVQTLKKKKRADPFITANYLHNYNKIKTNAQCDWADNDKYFTHFKSGGIRIRICFYYMWLLQIVAQIVGRCKRIKLSFFL